MSNNCPNCSTVVDADAVFCTACGNSIAQTIHCPKCNGTIPAEAKFCKYCALDLNKWREEVQAQPSMEMAQPSLNSLLQRQTEPNQVQPIASPSELDAHTRKKRYIQPESPPPTIILPTQQTETAPDNPTSFISPAGAAFAVICFFLPWLQVSQCGITKTASGAELANFDTSFWLLPLMGIASITAYFVAKGQKQIWKARPFIIISSGFALLLLFYKYFSIPSAPEIMGQRVTAADLGITLQFGGYGTVLGFILAIVGCIFISRQTTGISATANPQNFSASLPMIFEFTENKLKSNAAAALCYILPSVLLLFVGFFGSESGALLLLVIALSFGFQIFSLNSVTYKNSPLIRFHAYQSIFLVAGYYVCSLLLVGLVLAVSSGSSFFDPSFWSQLQFVGLIWAALNIAYFGLTIFMAVKSYQNQVYKLPYIGDWAMQRAEISNSDFVKLMSPTTTQSVPILQPAQPISAELPSVAAETVSFDSAQTKKSETGSSEMFSTEVTDSSVLTKEGKLMLGIGVGIVFLMVIGFVVSSSNSKPSSNSSYNANTYSYDSTNSLNTAVVVNSNSMFGDSEMDSVPHYPVGPDSMERAGRLTTDSNVRSEPNKDAASLGIHFRNAKVEILEETSFMKDEGESTWYKIRVTEYGCSVDTNLGCGKNNSNDSDEGWVNAKNVLVTDGSQPSWEESNERLTEANINTLLSAMDSATNNKDVAGFCSYLSANAKISTSLGGSIQERNRNQTCDLMRRTAISDASLNITRQNTKIMIASDGQTASVTSNTILNATGRGDSGSAEVVEAIILGLENGKPVITSLERKIRQLNQK